MYNLTPFNQMKKLLLTFSLLLCVTLIVGCGPKRPEGMPALLSCVLTIQYEDGSPVDNASVSLAPEDASLMQWSISGSTNASGVATITTNGDFTGAPAGKYKVVVRKSELVQVNEIDAFGAEVTEKLQSLIAEEFTNPGKTPHSLEVGRSPVKETFKVAKLAK
jgi:hypothetical protein